MRKTKKDAKVAARRKEIKERADEQLWMDNISAGLSDSTGCPHKRRVWLFVRNKKRNVWKNIEES